MHILVWSAQKGISVDLDEPDAEVFVQQEVKTEQFKAVLAVVAVHFLLDAQKGVDDDVFDARQEQLVDIYVVLAEVLVEVLLQVIVVERVALLVQRVRIQLHLQTLVRQMHLHVFVLQVVLG